MGTSVGKKSVPIERTENPRQRSAASPQWGKSRVGGGRNHGTLLGALVWVRWRLGPTKPLGDCQSRGILESRQIKTLKGDFRR